MYRLCTGKYSWGNHHAGEPILGRPSKSALLTGDEGNMRRQPKGEKVSPDSEQDSIISARMLAEPLWLQQSCDYDTMMSCMGNVHNTFHCKMEDRLFRVSHPLVFYSSPVKHIQRVYVTTCMVLINELTWLCARTLLVMQLWSSPSTASLKQKMGRLGKSGEGIKHRFRSLIIYG